MTDVTVYVPEMETGRHVKNNAWTVEIKIKWMIRKHMTYENTYRDDIHLPISVKGVQPDINSLDLPLKLCRQSFNG